MTRAFILLVIALGGACVAPVHAQAPACGVARGEAPRLIARIEPRAEPQPAGRPNATPADAFDAAAAGSLLKGEMAAAASAALQALMLELTPRRAANAGVALMYMGDPDDAAKFFACARSLQPDLVYALEGEALLAHRRKQCPEAKRLIDEVASRMPRDANARYSAGIIHYKCGDRARAASELRAAVDMAGVDPVMVDALAVVAPGATPVSPTPKAVRKKIDEVFRFMDEAIATARHDRDLLERIARAYRLSDTELVDRGIKVLEQGVAQRKEAILRLEKASASLAQLGPEVWNGLLTECVRSYFQTLMDLYRARVPGSGIGQAMVMAAAMGVEPAGLVERARQGSGWIIQEQMQIYRQVVAANTNVRGVGTICEPIREAYQAMMDRSLATREALIDGFPRAAADYANVWLAYAAEAADYAKRTAAVARFARNSPMPQPAWNAHLRSTYQSMVRGAVLDDMASFLRHTQTYAADAVRSSKPSLESARIRSCYDEPVRAATLADALALLADALAKAGSFDASLDTPDCTIALGSVKVSCKPLAFEGVKATWSGPVKVSVTADGERWGVDASAGPLSGSSRGERMNVSSTSSEASYYGIKGEVGMSSWIERGANGEANAYVQAKGSLGVGVDAEGLGSVGCEFFNASAKLNLRAFAEALTR